MFERFNESARRVLFYARYETSATGALKIDSEHLLLGLLREPRPVVRRILAGVDGADRLREELESRIPFREKIATSHEVPFSERTQRLLNYTAQEADTLGHAHIGPEHMLLALLRVPESGGGEVLASHGMRLETVRETVKALVADGAPAPYRLRVDIEGAAADIDRILGLVGQVVMIQSTPPEARELLHLIHVELRSLRSRFS